MSFANMVTYRVKRVFAWIFALAIIGLIFAGVAFLVMHA